jgi:hypothetical protein
VDDNGRAVQHAHTVLNDCGLPDRAGHAADRALFEQTFNGR